jgi:hypothetical protein
MSNLFSTMGEKVAANVAAKKIGDVAKAAGDEVGTAEGEQEKTPEEVEKELEDYIRDRLLSGGRRGGVTDMTSTLGQPSMARPSAPVYDPARLYGSLYQMYGGRPVRGGLLGE